MFTSYLNSYGIKTNPMLTYDITDSEAIASYLEEFHYNIELKEQKIAKYEELLKRVFNQKRESMNKGV